MVLAEGTEEVPDAIAEKAEQAVYLLHNHHSS